MDKAQKERKNLEQRLSFSMQSKQRYKLLVDHVRDYAIFLLDPNGYIMTWNLGAEILKGYKPTEIIGKHFSVFYTPPDVERKHPEEELKIAKETGRYQEEGWRIRKDGSRFWANILITRLNDENGVHIGFAKITRDLTEKKKAEEALKESEERLRLIIDSVKDYAIIMLDPKGRIASWNEGARRLKGYEAEEVKGKHFSIFYEPDDIAMGKCEYEIKEATATGRFEDEGWRVRKDGTKFWANIVLTALRDDQGHLRGFAKITRDITEKKRAEEKLRMAYDSLEKRVVQRTKELQKAVEARDEFLSIASHELRTPLTALKLQQQLFERRLTREGHLSPEALKNMAAMSGRQVSQLSRLIDDMLDVSRIATGRLRLEIKNCDVSESVSRVFEMFSNQFQAAGIQARLDLEENLTMPCDEQRIEQVVANLLSNAIKYGEGAPIEVKSRREGSMITIIVKDHGPGISPEDQKRVFERFERATPANEVSGLGLGLFISKQIVEAHDGHIQVNSAPKEGATFKISFPLQE